VDGRGIHVVFIRDEIGRNCMRWWMDVGEGGWGYISQEDIYRVNARQGRDEWARRGQHAPLTRAVAMQRNALIKAVEAEKVYGGAAARWGGPCARRGKLRGLV